MDRKLDSLSAMYRGLLIRLKNLIVSPGKEWVNIMDDKLGINAILSAYSLPLMGIAALSTFLGYLFDHQDLHFDLALQKAAFAFSAFFFGLYLAYFIVRKTLPVFGLSENKDRVFALTAFPSLMIYIIHLFTALFPEIFFMQFMVFYAAYVIWESLPVIGKLPTEKRIYLTGVISGAVLFLPYIIFNVLYKISGS